MNGNLLTRRAGYALISAMNRKDLERAFGEKSERIAEELTKLGFPISRQAVHKWRGKVPNRSAKIIRAIVGPKVKALG
jgi:hypothetical protein